VTILPVDTIKPRHLTGIESLRKLDGFVGIAAELVEMPPEMNDIKFNLLGSTVIADNLNAATQIAREGHYRFRVVSLDGQVVNAGGSMTGGANQKSGSTILRRQTDLKALNERVGNLTAFVKNLEHALQNQREQNDDLRKTLQQSQAALSTAKNATAQIDYELSRKQDSVRQQERVVKALQFESQDITQQLEDLCQQLETNNQVLETAQLKQQEQESAAERLKQELQTISIRSQTSQDERSQVQAAHATVEAKIDSLLEQLKLLKGQRDDATDSKAFHALKRFDTQVKEASNN